MTHRKPTSGNGEEQVQDPSKRRLLKAGLAIGGSAAIDQLPLRIFWRDNEEQVRHEQDKISTRRLALVMPGIGRKHADDVVGALSPSLSDHDTTLASLSYGDDNMNARAAADAIRASGCKELTLVGQSIGGGFSTEVVRELEQDILAGEITVEMILLNSPYNGSHVQNGAAAALEVLPASLTVDTIADAVAFGGLNRVSPRLEDAQLRYATGFDGARVAPDIAHLITRALYIGDPDSDGVIRTGQASQGYKAAWGDKLTVVLESGIGHPDPAKNPNQANTLNRIISDWREDSLVTTP